MSQRIRISFLVFMVRWVKNILLTESIEPNLLNQLDSLGLWSIFLTYSSVLIGLGARNTGSSVS